MNSYILTSKVIKKRLLFAFLLVVIMMTVLDGLLYYIIDSRTTKNSFVEEKQSKIKHFNLNKKLNRDIVFIGDSRTLFHISSSIFKENNLDIYNFGLSGNTLVDFPAYVDSAIKQFPKAIVLNLALEDIYTSIEKPSNPSIKDIAFYKNIGDNKLLLQNIYQWFLSYHIIFNYSEALVLKGKILYDRLKPNKKNNTYVDTLESQSKLNYDCTPFSSQKMNHNKTVVKCTNGDGLLLGVIDMLPLRKNKILKEINPLKLLILKSLIKNIEKNKIKVIIMFEPILYNKYIVENNLEKDLQGIAYLNLSNYSIGKKLVVDAGHFNMFGREKYSKYLVKLLKDRLDD